MINALIVGSLTLIVLGTIFVIYAGRRRVYGGRSRVYWTMRHVTSARPAPKT